MALPIEDVRNLPVPELAIRLLAELAKGSDLNVNNLFRGYQQSWSRERVPDIHTLLERLSDAWAWLEAHALIGPHATNTKSEWSRLTTHGRDIAARPSALPELWATERLAGSLHPMLEEKVRPLFHLGDYETAAFAALKAVEVEVRRLAGFDDSTIGVSLMRGAFKPEGPLADEAADPGERVALMELFAGAIGAFKNPASHRTVSFDDPIEAAEILQLADLLLRILTRIERRLSERPT